jgi:hypothetical protein
MEKARLLWFGYSGKDDHAHFAVIKKLKEEDSIDFFVATGVKPHQSDSKVLNEPLYMHHDFLFANYQVSLSSGIPLIDQKIYQLCSDFEGETLRMMDRLHGRGPENRFIDNFDTRRRMFLLHCSFWYSYLIDRRISHLVFIGIPHEVVTFVAYKVANILKLSVMILSPEKAGAPRKIDGIYYSSTHPQNSMTKSTFFVSESLEDVGLWQLSSKLLSAGESLGLKFSKGENLFMPIFERYGDTKTPESKSPKPSFALSVFNEIRKTPKRRVELTNLLLNTLKSQRQRQKHRALVEYSPDTRKVMLFSLAYQPEESTSPRGGIFVEQYFSIRALSSCLPHGWKVRVREHPDQYGRGRPRPKDFLREISLLPRVEIVAVDETSDDSLIQADAVAATAGTMAVEAWARGIPLILFGKMWLKIAPGVFYIETIDDLKHALQTICEGTKPTPEQIESFKSWTISQSFSGSLGKIDPNNQELKSVTIQNIENIFRSWLSIRGSDKAKSLSELA